MKKLKINYLFIGILTLLLAAALWPSIPWFGKTENHIAAIQARGVLRVSTIDSPLTYSVINGKKYGLDYELAQQFRQLSRREAESDGAPEYQPVV
ncbi:Transglycosylase Slt family [Salmonella sp. NCTC 11881]|nr:Transglycosylase Slt family [Salmonella sp. NCTC 11881]